MTTSLTTADADLTLTGAEAPLPSYEIRVSFSPTLSPELLQRSLDDLHLSASILSASATSLTARLVISTLDTHLATLGVVRTLKDACLPCEEAWVASKL